MYVVHVLLRRNESKSTLSYLALLALKLSLTDKKDREFGWLFGRLWWWCGNNNAFRSLCTICNQQSQQYPRVPHHMHIIVLLSRRTLVHAHEFVLSSICVLFGGIITIYLTRSAICLHTTKFRAYANRRPSETYLYIWPTRCAQTFTSTWSIPHVVLFGHDDEAWDSQVEERCGKWLRERERDKPPSSSLDGRTWINDEKDATERYRFSHAVYLLVLFIRSAIFQFNTSWHNCQDFYTTSNCSRGDSLTHHSLKLM